VATTASAVEGEWAAGRCAWKTSASLTGKRKKKKEKKEEKERGDGMVQEIKKTEIFGEPRTQ
jgi:hypothetical protein